jgi:uncharacterized membrane protein/glutaredoxin
MVQSASRRGRAAHVPDPLPNRETPGRAPRSSVRVRRRQPVPLALDIVMLVAAIVGLFVATYLTFVDMTGGSTLCLAGSDCDIVRDSSFGSLLGVPVAALGVLYFVVVVAAVAIPALRQRALLHVLGGVGLGAAVIFVGLQAIILQAWCPYCLVADAAALAIGVRSLQIGAAGRLGRVVVGATLAVAVLIAGYAVDAPPASSATTAASADGMSQDQLVALADHLRDSGATFYGAYWCPHCQAQKAMFGAAASHLPYVECDPSGTNAQPDACQAAGVKAYPTWVINGQTHEGEVQPAELAQLSGFQS